MNKKELSRKDLEAIAAGQDFIIPSIAIGTLIYIVAAADLAACNMTAAQVEEKTGCQVQVV